MIDKTASETYTVIRARIDGRTRLQFQRLARHAGKTESELLREIIAIVINQPPPQSLKPAMPDSGNVHPSKITLRLPAFLLDAVRQRAGGHGMAASRWIVSLVQSNLMEIPVMTSDELRQLDKCTAELSAIGRNLNQAVRILHADPRATSNLKFQMIHVLLSSIEQTQQSIRNLSQAASRRWKHP